jgi:hypothetical protein
LGQIDPPKVPKGQNLSLKKKGLRGYLNFGKEAKFLNELGISLENGNGAHHFPCDLKSGGGPRSV